MKRKFSLVFLIACVGMIFLGYFKNEQISAANEKIDSDAIIFQNVRLAKYDSKSKILSKEFLKDEDMIGYDDSFKVSYRIVVPNQLEKEEAQIKLPVIIPSVDGVTKIKDKLGKEIGQWEITEDKILNVQLDKSSIKENTEVDIEFDATLDHSVFKSDQKSIVLDFNTKKVSQLKLNVESSKRQKIKSSSSDSKETVRTNKGITEKSRKIETKSVTNKAMTNYIKVKTVDAEDNNNMVDATVVLYSHDNLNEYIAIAVSVNGEVIFPNLKPGKYRIAAGISEGYGYFASRNKLYVDVDLPSSENELFLEYVRGWGSIKVVKQDEDTKEKLAGAVFKLVKNNPDNTTEIVKDGLVSNSKGIVQVDQLFSGEYSLIETKAPENYILDSTPVKLILGLNGEGLVYPEPASKPVFNDGNYKTKTNKKAVITMNNSTFPANLDFGKHKIQNSIDEVFTATENGNNTVGKVVVDDTRTSGGWTLKVKQDGAFTNDIGTALDKTELNVNIGTVTSTAQKLPSQIKTSVSLKNGIEDKIAVAQPTEGIGSTIIPLEKFTLSVPKNTRKKAKEYTSSLTWTLSNVPE